MTSKELLDLYYESTKQLLKKWSITVENDFLLMTFFGLLRKLCKKNKLKEEDFLSLVSNIKNVVSAEQVDLLKELSENLKGHKDLFNLSKSKKYNLCLNEIHQNPKYTDLKLDIRKYLEKYGGRFANELKLESEDLDTNPEFMIKLLVNYSNIESTNKSNIQPKSFNLSVKESIKLKFLTKKIKHYARKREELRLLRAQSFSVARKLFKSIGDKFMGQDILDEARDIFYLEVDEIIRQIEGSSVTVNLKEIVNLRKKQYLEFKDKEIDDVFFTEGDPYLSLPSKSLENNGLISLNGEGCSPGIIKGKVKILDSFDIPEDEEYEIIVTKHTDPGWTPLFGLCKGLIVEHGGLLSHAAIISRELNLPCVIGIRDATKNLKDGQIVTINGYTGEVKIHE
jgi:pyruvate,water dikinase